jgi:hypothetical protein
MISALQKIPGLTIAHEMANNCFRLGTSEGGMEMQMIKILKSVWQQISVGAIALMLIGGLTHNANAYTFDADGTGGTAPLANVAALDWGPTSFLALDGVQAIQNFQAGCVSSCNFDVITQAKLIGITDFGANNVIPSSFLGASPTTEITMVTRFTETVTSVTGTTANFAITPNQPLYIELYFDTSPDAVAVSGSGYDDGRLILKGTLLLNSTGQFQVTSLTTFVDLDQAVADGNTNDYDTQQTVAGSGDQGNLAFGGLTADNTFFIDALAAFGLQFSNVSINLPFISIDPADCFPDYAANTGSGTAVTGTNATTDCANNHVDGLMSAQGADGGFIPNIGPINGFLVAGQTADDFIAQTDFNSPLTPAEKVTEPASFLLFGLGLLGMGGYLRARTRKTK